ncbi:hypothetical protein TNCV_3717481 [Trichonephila clavipes]|nr:hypothetical protein TNCV_3717481 [Trichonephila clavipes]
MLYGGRPRPIHGDDHHMQPVDILSEITSILEDTTGRKHLTVEIIRIMILLTLNRERNETPIVAEAQGAVGPCHKTSLNSLGKK